MITQSLFNHDSLSTSTLKFDYTGGQFGPAKGGQFQPAKGGHFKPVSGGQYHRILQSKGKIASKKKAPEFSSEDLLQKIGARIKTLRIREGHTSYEYFAYEHDIPRAQYGRYEQGQDLRISSLGKVVNAFGMTMKEFFSEGFD